MENTLARSAPRRRPRVRSLLSGCVGAFFKLLSAVLVLASCVSAGAVAALFQFPSLASLLPPPGAWVVPTQPELIARLNSPTPVPTLTVGTPGDGDAFPTLPPEWTATHTPTLTPTPPPPSRTPASGTPSGPTGTPSATERSGASATPGGPTPTATRTRSSFAYTLQNNSVTYLANFINASGCNWFGFTGQAFGLDGRPIIGLTVHLEGGGLSLDALTGSQPAIGPGGYEIPLGNHPVETSDTYTVQLRNNTGTALSDTIVVETFGDCTRNLVLVNFVQNH
jgi:hypothetical protein